MKDKAYKHILNFGIIHLRNFFFSEDRRSKRFEAERCIAQLLHYVPPLLWDVTPGPGDVYFLSVGANSFFTHYPFKDETFFIQIADLILELDQITRAQMAVDWVYPENIKSEVLEFRRKIKEHMQ